MSLTICTLNREPRSATRNNSLSVLWNNTLLGIVPLYAIKDPEAQENPVAFVRQAYRDALKAAGDNPDLDKVREQARVTLKLQL